MSNLYYNYRGDNAHNPPPPINPPSQPLVSQGKDLQNPLSAFPTATVPQPIQLQPSSALPSGQATTAGFSSPQAWAADQQHSHQSSLPQQAQTSQHQPSLVNIPYPRTELSRTTPSPAMNGTRAAPLGTRRVSQYDDSLLQMMGKGYPEKSAASNPPVSSSVSSSSIQPTPAGTLDRYQQIRSGSASNVLDPNEFPSLGGGLAGQGGIAAGAAALLNSSSASDANPLGPVMPGSSTNGLSPYDNMYSVGGFADGRVKAVDAVTGASAASEFSMHSEDFPALGGNSAPGPMRGNILGNGSSNTSMLPAPASRMGASVSSGEKMGLYDGYLESSPGPSVPAQPHSIAGKAIARPEPPSTGVPFGRASPPPGEFHVNHNRPNVIPQPQTRNPPSHAPGPVQEPNRSPANAGFSARPLVADKTARDDIPAPLADRKVPEGYGVLEGGNGRAGKVLPSSEMKGIPNGDVLGLSGLPSNAPGSKVQGSSSLLTRTTNYQRKDEGRDSGSFLAPDQFGMKGLLRYVGEEAEGTDANMLAIGVDLTMLGLDLNSPEPLHKTFANPWEGGQGATPGSRDTAGPTQKNEEPEYKLPTCYYMQPPALKNSHFTKFQLETLFYVFYNMPRDVLQVLAAIELYNRKWRYHKDLKLWFTCEPEVLQGYERGAYIYFDIKSWEQRPFHDANQSFIQGLMTEEELRSVPMPGQRSTTS